ncbi:Asp23/Gls24 family envelope stress response protein [Aquipuribacter hungaricus]|uniref:Asp23/Gls24 family envelope stress response protein n=1 Tax=Aquipuribacter hungaricus TaxID=545624 RepID=A0ABV7WJ04_9MICO
MVDAIPAPAGHRDGAGTRGATSSPAAPGSALATTDSALDSGLGRTTISDTVVSKIAGIAARDVVGVHSLGGGATRAVSALRERIPGGRTNYAQGVAVEVGERQAAVDVDIVAEYGVSIADLAAGIRENVVTAVERMTGLQVTEVNIVVHDVHVESDDDDTDGTVVGTEAPRVR